MNKVLSFVAPEPNKELIEALEKLVDDAKDGLFVGAIIVKLDDTNEFGVQAIGTYSNLKLAGALAFAQHDLMMATPIMAPKGSK